MKTYSIQDLKDLKDFLLECYSKDNAIALLHRVTYLNDTQKGFIFSLIES